MNTSDEVTAEDVRAAIAACNAEREAAKQQVPGLELPIEYGLFEQKTEDESLLGGAGRVHTIRLQPRRED